MSLYYSIPNDYSPDYSITALHAVEINKTLLFSQISRIQYWSGKKNDRVMIIL